MSPLYILLGQYLKWLFCTLSKRQSYWWAKKSNRVLRGVKICNCYCIYLYPKKYISNNMYVGWWIICAALHTTKQTENSMCMRNRYVIAHFAFSRQNYRFIAGNFTQPLLPASSYLRRYLGLHTRFGQFTSARNLNSRHLRTDDNVATRMERTS